VMFGKMKTSHYDGWDETVDIYLQVIRSSFCRGGFGDVFFDKLQHNKTEVTMHHYYSKVGVQLMQDNGVMEKKEKINLTQVLSVAHSLLPLNSFARTGYYKTCTESATISSTTMY
jgi:hypothetical protein